MGALKQFLKKTQFRVGALGFYYEISPDDFLNHESVDERISKLEKVRSDLMDAVNAVESLQEEAASNKKELEKVSEQLEKLKEDKKTTENLLELPQQSFARVIDKASRAAQWKGILVGFIFGILASLIATWIWNNTPLSTREPISEPNQAEQAVSPKSDRAGG